MRGNRSRYNINEKQETARDHIRKTLPMLDLLVMPSNVLAGLVQPHIFFCFLRQQTWHFVSLRPGTCVVATRVSGSKWVQSTEIDILVNVSLCNLCALALGLALHIFAT